MTREMYDSVNANNIPTDIPLVAGYVNGQFQWPQSWWDRFPGHYRHVGIDVFGTAPTIASVLDVEQFDATPQISVEWVKARNATKPEYPPVLYVNRSNLDTVVSLNSKAGHVLGRDYMVWVATLDGTKELPNMHGVVAVQYHDAGGYDQSVVYDDAWHAAPAPVKPPTPPVVTPPKPPAPVLTEQEIQAFATVIEPVVWNAIAVKLKKVFGDAVSEL